MAFLVALAFAVAASGNLPAILYSLFWKRFNTSGAVWAIYGGLISRGGAGVLLAGRLRARRRRCSRTADWQWFPLSNPGIISIPFGFLCGWLGTVLSQGADRRGEVRRAGGPLPDRRRRALTDGASRTPVRASLPRRPGPATPRSRAGAPRLAGRVVAMAIAPAVRRRSSGPGHRRCRIRRRHTWSTPCSRAVHGRRRRQLRHRLQGQRRPPRRPPAVHARRGRRHRRRCRPPPGAGRAVRRDPAHGLAGQPDRLRQAADRDPAGRLGRPRCTCSTARSPTAPGS